MSKASELIQEIKDLMDKYGDLEVVDENDQSVGFEFNEDGDSPVILLS